MSRRTLRQVQVVIILLLVFVVGYLAAETADFFRFFRNLAGS